MIIRRRSLSYVVFVGALFILAANVLANGVKTTESYITSGDTAISSATSSAFSLYIGDNLSGVTSPVKSVHVLVSGVYTGNGTLAVQVDSGSSQSYTLPNVGTTPTPFELLYDSSGTIAPTSAGTYTYTLNVTPSGVTVYGYAAKLVETHEFVPASCADGQPANEKVKTTESYITSGDTAISSATSSAFSLYIGDNLSGVTSPVKSVHVLVSGVYTGNGTLAVQVDSGSSQSYTLPNVGTTPTPFELLYDSSGTIAPTSAGTYTYTLNVTPSGVTVYGYAAKLQLTHRYRPPTCGGLSPTGFVDSDTFDTGIANGAAYNSLRWEGSIPGGVGRVRLQIATSNSSSGPWNYAGPGAACDNTTYYEPAAGTPVAIDLACSAIQNKRYFRYKATLCSANDCSTAGATTPTVTSVIINWSP